MTVVVLLGAPGAGKGTQAKVLADRLGVPHIATGDLFRAAVRDDTEIGRRAAAYMSRGELVPDDITVQMLLERLARRDAARGAVLDGFPRNRQQAAALDTALAARGGKVDRAICIEVPADDLVRRLSGRWTCRADGHVYHEVNNPPRAAGICDIDGSALYQRDDDRAETVRARLAQQLGALGEVVAYYRERGILGTVDGRGSIDDVAAALEAQVASLPEERLMALARARQVTVKSASEIARMRRAGRVVAEVLALVESELRPGISTGELDRLAERHIRSAGATPSFKGYPGSNHRRPFPASLCISIDDEIVHGIPGERTIREGMLVSVDAGAIVDDWHGDGARTFYVGAQAPAATRALIDTTRLAMMAGIAAARPGNHVEDIGAAVEDIATAAGYGVVRHYVGHGIGRRMHEEPQVPNYRTGWTGRKLEAGLCLAIEPMFTLGSYETKTLPDGWTVVTADGSLAAHFEHTIAITDGGAEILTTV